MKIKPLGKMVLVEPMSQAEMNSGVIIPDSVRKDRANMGTVLVSGPESKLKKGEKVIYNPYSPEMFKIEGKELALIEEKDIYATYAE